MTEIKYEYWGVFCGTTFVALWRHASGMYAAGMPKLSLNGPTVVPDCPGCRKDHLFQPQELKACSGPEQKLHPFEELSEG